MHRKKCVVIFDERCIIFTHSTLIVLQFFLESRGMNWFFFDSLFQQRFHDIFLLQKLIDNFLDRQPIVRLVGEIALELGLLHSTLTVR